MDRTELILSIADGTLSISRIKRLAKAIYNLEFTPAEIAAVTTAHNISTPQRPPAANELERQYPDRWSIFLEAVSFWVRVRRYWGDEKARELKDRIFAANQALWRGLSAQFESYTAALIHDRADINLNSVSGANELEALYPWDLQKELYLQAYDREFENHPESKTGAKFPLPSPEWREFKTAQYEQDCLALAPSEEVLIQSFAQFWQTVYRNRGEQYFEDLKQSLVGVADQPLSQRPFYSATETNFKHFLANLNGFANKAPWRIPKIHEPRLTMTLEGAILKYGWQKVQSMVAIGLISAWEED